MSEPDRTYLKTILEQHREGSFSDLAPDKHFEIFTAEQILKRFALDSEDIESGLTGGGLDEGVDSLYFMVDRRVIREDPEIKSFQKRDIQIDLIIIQSKLERGFTEDTINRLMAMTNDLLDLSKNINQLKATVYNVRLHETLERFRRTYKALLIYRPALTISFYYATQGDKPSANVRRKAELLKQRVTELYSAATCKFEFVTAKDILTLYNKSLPKTITLSPPKSCRPLSSAQHTFVWFH